MENWIRHEFNYSKHLVTENSKICPGKQKSLFDMMHMIINKYEVENMLEPWYNMKNNSGFVFVLS